MRGAWPVGGAPVAERAVDPATSPRGHFTGIPTRSPCTGVAPGDTSGRPQSCMPALLLAEKGKRLTTPAYA
jgi:hypothetical protein